MFYTDHDVLDLQYKLIIKCKKCGYCTKTYLIPYEEMYEAGTYDFITMSPTVQKALYEFDEHVESKSLKGGPIYA